MGHSKPFGGISGSTLKLIAIVTMFIDHMGATVLRAICQLPAVASDPGLRARWLSVYNISRDIGRLAFPIFCFLLVEGFLHTRSVKKYAGRLFGFALLSEIPFDIALKGSWYYPDKQNVYFTLLIGLLVLAAISYFERLLIPDSCAGAGDGASGGPVRAAAAADPEPADAFPKEGRFPAPLSSVLRGLLCLLLSVLAAAAGMYLASLINTDYNYKGVLLIVVLYLSRHNRLLQCITGAAATAWELPAPLGYLPVYLYNGRRGLRMKYFFYWFYPVHLMLLYAVTNYVLPALI